MTTGWMTEGDHLARQLAGIRWAWGDHLNQAPTVEHRTRLVNAHPDIDVRDHAAAMTVAERIPPERRRPGLSWRKHEAVHELPDHLADQILDDATLTPMTLQEVTQAAAIWKRRLKKASQPELDEAS